MTSENGEARDGAGASRGLPGREAVQRIRGQARELAGHAAWALRWVHARHPGLVRQLGCGSSELVALLPWLLVALALTLSEGLSRFAQRYDAAQLARQACEI